MTGVLNDVSAATVFDVLNDPQYRKNWDPSMHEGFEICQFSANSDIGYYACTYHTYGFCLTVPFVWSYFRLCQYPKVNFWKLL